jgi:hypothetical protein
MKKIMAVALARKLLVALWSYVETGVVPEGARLPAAKGRQNAIRRETTGNKEPGDTSAAEDCANERISYNSMCFSGARPRKALGSEERMKAGATVHGFQSTFRDWAGDETSFPREVPSKARAHAVGGVEGDYRRPDARVN